MREEIAKGIGRLEGKRNDRRRVLIPDEHDINNDIRDGLAIAGEVRRLSKLLVENHIEEPLKD